jgi:hypothetical protein
VAGTGSLSTKGVKMDTPNPVPPPQAIPQGNRFFDLWNKAFVRHVLLTLGMIALIIVIGKFSRDFAETKAVEWLSMYNGMESKSSGVVPMETPSGNSNAAPQTSAANANSGTNLNANANVNQVQGGNTDVIPPANQNRSAPETEGAKPSAPDPKQQQRFDEQLKNIRARISHHGTVMAFFYKAYYMSISVVMFAGLIAALALFFIAQNGWMGTNSYVKNVFLVMTAAAAYYGLFPSVFEQQKNITDNKALFLTYKTLENEVISYPLTGTNIKGEKKTTQEFINYLDMEMSRLGNIAIGFDSTKISYKGTFDITDTTSDGSSNASASGNANKAKPGNKNQ